MGGRTGGGRDASGCVIATTPTLAIGPNVTVLISPPGPCVRGTGVYKTKSAVSSQRRPYRSSSPSRPSRVEDGIGVPSGVVGSVWYWSPRTCGYEVEVLQDKERKSIGVIVLGSFEV